MHFQRRSHLAGNRGSLWLICLLFLMLLPPFTLPLRAQLLVDFSLQRTLYIAYEPLLATVRITNLSGSNLLLADVEGKKWFGFQIETLDGRPIPPIDPNYEIEPVQIGAGESITRTVNLTPLYPLGDYGSYRVRATVYAAELGGYFSSPAMTVEITEGRLLWQQTVGVPGINQGPGSGRTISLLAQRLPDKTDLYLRIQDKNAGIVYCTSRLGDFISYGKPQVLLDSTNAIHILQNSAPRLFVYSKISLDGKILSRLSYNAPKTRPNLVRSPDGSVGVVGGIPFDPHATPPPNQMGKLSDRPVPLPTPETSLSPVPKSKVKSSSKGNPTPPPKTTAPTD